MVTSASFPGNATPGFVAKGGANWKIREGIGKRCEREFFSCLLYSQVRFLPSSPVWLAFYPFLVLVRAPRTNSWLLVIKWLVILSINYLTSSKIICRRHHYFILTDSQTRGQECTIASLRKRTKLLDNPPTWI